MGRSVSAGDDDDEEPERRPSRSGDCGDRGWDSTREAARRFRIAISTAGAWYHRYRETGETEARKQGQPSRSKLDAHEAFILGLIEEAPDITLAEIGQASCRRARREGCTLDGVAVPRPTWHQMRSNTPTRLQGMKRL